MARMIKKALRILSSKSGYSLIAVLCTISLLLILGISALTAASAAAVSLESRSAKQLDILANATSKSFLRAITTEGDGSLGENIVNNVYQSSDLDITPAVTRLSELTLTLGGDSAVAQSVTFYTAKLELSEVDVEITPEIPYQAPIKDKTGAVVREEILRQPKRAKINFMMTVTFELEYDGLTAKLRDTYSLTGALLEDGGASSTPLEITNAGEWRLLAHERLSD
jgi:hypothetical protein